MKYLKYSCLVAIFIPLLVSISCQKSELISKVPVRAVFIDTLMYEGLDLPNFYIPVGSSDLKAIAEGDYLYIVVVDDNSPVFTYKDYLYKINRHTGQILWKWKDFDPGDNGFMTKLAIEGSNLLLVTSDRAYIIDQQSGNTSYTYASPTQGDFADAALHEGELYVLYGQNQSLRLDKMQSDGSALQNIHQVSNSPDYFIIPLSIDIYGQNKTSIAIQYQKKLNSPIVSATLLIKREPDHPVFFEYSLGMSTYSNDKSPVEFFSSGNVAVADENGYIKLLTLETSDPIAWAQKSPSDELFQNNSSIFAKGKKLSIFDKKDGAKKASSNPFPKVLGVNDEILVADGYPKFKIYEPNDLSLIHSFGDSFNCYHLTQISNREFFFADRTDDGRVGIIRIISPEE